VNDPTPARGGGPRLPGVIDTLTAGYGVINRRPWIVLIPVLLDLFFLFGPQVSAAPLIGQALSRPALQRALGEVDPETTETVRQRVIAAADELNLLALLSPGWISIPTIVPLLGDGRGPFTFVDSAGMAAIISLGAIVGGALLGCFYRTIIAQQVRDAVIAPAALPGETIAAWLRLLGLMLILILLGLVIGVPILFVVALATVFSREIGSFGMAMVMTALIWLQFFLFFAPDAIFVSRVGPRAALGRSVAVVRANFWAAVRIIVLVTIILLGMGQVWVALADRIPWGNALGIVGNAYIASGLVAATMLFYRERVAALPLRRVATAREA
jgi:hypothetical protein